MAQGSPTINQSWPICAHPATPSFQLPRALLCSTNDALFRGSSVPGRWIAFIWRADNTGPHPLAIPSFMPPSLPPHLMKTLASQRKVAGGAGHRVWDVGGPGTPVGCPWPAAPPSSAAAPPPAPAARPWSAPAWYPAPPAPSPAPQGRPRPLAVLCLGGGGNPYADGSFTKSNLKNSKNTKSPSHPKSKAGPANHVAFSY